MALSGLVLSLFVLGHMLGNLQFFLGPEALNRYAFMLHQLPLPLLWGVRLLLLSAALAHAVTGIVLRRENQKAAGKPYAVQTSIQASYASRTMLLSGSTVLIFIIFHLLHYSLGLISDYKSTLAPYILGSGEAVFDVHAMLVEGFSQKGISLFYITSIAFLALHLSHGMSSLFQSVGLRKQAWKPFLDVFAKGYGWAVFLGFSAIPCSVLFSKP